MKSVLRKPTPYENRIVTYLDILGFRDLVNANQVPKIQRAMKIMEARLSQIEGVTDSPVKAIQFSDSVFVSALNDAEGTINLVHFTSLLASELFLAGIWCRGAIASGHLHHVRNEVYGPALVQAYEMESQLAIYPRILITPEAADAFVDYKNKDRPPSRHRSSGSYFRRDFDNQLHLDIFSDQMFIPPQTGTIREAMKGVQEHLMESLFPSSGKATDLRVQGKLFWLSKYLEYVKEVHGETHFNVTTDKKGRRRTSFKRPPRNRLKKTGG